MAFALQRARYMLQAARAYHGEDHPLTMALGSVTGRNEGLLQTKQGGTTAIRRPRNMGAAFLCEEGG